MTKKCDEKLAFSQAVSRRSVGSPVNDKRCDEKRSPFWSLVKKVSWDLVGVPKPLAFGSGLGLHCACTVLIWLWGQSIIVFISFLLVRSFHVADWTIMIQWSRWYISIFSIQISKVKFIDEEYKIWRKLYLMFLTSWLHFSMNPINHVYRHKSLYTISVKSPIDPTKSFHEIRLLWNSNWIWIIIPLLSLLAVRCLDSCLDHLESHVDHTTCPASLPQASEAGTCPVGTPHEWRKSVTKNEHFNKLSQKQASTTDLSAAGAKRDVENTLKVYFGPTIQSRPCQS